MQIPIDEALPDHDNAFADWLESELYDYDGRVVIVRVQKCECGTVNSKFAKFCDVCGKPLRLQAPVTSKFSLEERKPKTLERSPKAQKETIEINEKDYQPTPSELLAQTGVNIEKLELEKEGFQDKLEDITKPEKPTVEKEDVQEEVSDEQVREIQNKIAERTKKDKVEEVVKKAMVKKRKGRQRAEVTWKKRVKKSEQEPKQTFKEGMKAMIVDGPLKGNECEVVRVKRNEVEVVELASGMRMTLPIRYVR